jgi:methylated-DNA-[protein]-cysteine S-methyltransferase
MRRQRWVLSRILNDKDFTDFERRVYRVISQIPAGQTRSYKWVAVRCRTPKAFRAVGNALNKNPYPGIIPCHRVIKADGSVGGYSRGADLKKRLLRREKIDCTSKRCYNQI